MKLQAKRSVFMSRKGDTLGVGRAPQCGKHLKRSEHSRIHVEVPFWWRLRMRIARDARRKARVAAQRRR